MAVERVPVCAGGLQQAIAARAPACLIEVTARHNGTFTVMNTRNGFSKTDGPRP